MSSPPPNAAAKLLARSQPRIARRRIESVRKPLAAVRAGIVRRESRMTPTEARSEQVLESGVVQSKPVRRACIAAAKVGHHSEIAVEIIGDIGESAVRVVGGKCPAGIDSRVRIIQPDLHFGGFGTFLRIGGDPTE